MSQLRVLHLSTHDAGGGAARAAYRLHDGLRRAGLDSRMLVRHSRAGDPYVALLGPTRGARARLIARGRRWRRSRSLAAYRDTRPQWTEPFSPGISDCLVERASELRECDVVNLHWVADYLDLRRFFDGLPNSVPVVWTLHDMNLLTGGCHYDMGCGRFLEGCGSCPQLGSYRETDLSRRVWEMKQHLFSRLPPDRLRIVTPSRWLAGEARGSTLLGRRFEVQVIPYGLDLETFAPRDQSFAREVLGIPPDTRVVLFVAEAVGNRRKGFDLLLDAFRQLGNIHDPLLLLSIGKGGNVEAGVPHRSLGYTSDDRLLSLVYSAADVFVCPSRQDNLPLTALEALACGVPIAGFRVGGIPDMVRQDETGITVPPEDSAALAEAIRELLADDVKRSQLAAECRRVAIAEYGIEIQARRYARLYEARTTGSEGDADSSAGSAPESQQHTSSGKAEAAL